MTDPEPKFIGSEKHITFGGRTAGGVNIPGGLRQAEPVHHVEHHRHPAMVAARPAPVAVGWDRNITFGGHGSEGINIPGGLRMPVPKTNR